MPLNSTFEEDGTTVFPDNAVTFLFAHSTVGNTLFFFTLHYFSLFMLAWQDGQ